MVVKINGAPITVTDKPQVTLQTRDIVGSIAIGIGMLAMFEYATRTFLHTSFIHQGLGGLDHFILHGIKVVLRCISLLLP